MPHLCYYVHVYDILLVLHVLFLYVSISSKELIAIRHIQLCMSISAVTLFPHFMPLPFSIPPRSRDFSLCSSFSRLLPIMYLLFISLLSTRAPRTYLAYRSIL